MLDTFYIHRKDMNFYCTSLFGERTKEVIDPNWVRPKVKDEDGKEVEDKEAMPKMVVIDNPDCKLPAASELIEITDEQYRKYRDVAAKAVAGKVLNVVGDKVLIVDAPAETLAEAKVRKKAEINLACSAAIVGGFESDALGSTHTYPSTQEDQLNLTGLIQLSLIELVDGWSTYFACADSKGVWSKVPHTAKQIQTVGATFAKLKLKIIATKDALNASIDSATTVEAVNAISWKE
jgi:hypothetical protein